MSHVFLSYSTQNRDYALRLADKLRSEGFDVWLDNARLRASENWWEALVRALHSASACVIIMSPSARQSKWVQREITLADNWDIPTFPLLLEGDNFEIFVLTQFTDVRDGSLPPLAFYNDLAQHANREAEVGVDVTTREDVRAPINDEIMQAILDQLEPPPAEEGGNGLNGSRQPEANTVADYSQEGELSGFESSAAMGLTELLSQQANTLLEEVSSDEEASAPDKPPSKKKDTAQADWNFVSQHSLEHVVHKIEQLPDSHIVWIDNDTALFQLAYQRDGRRTAEISGRVRRWAGDMTHVYCDGRIFLKPINRLRHFVLGIPVIAIPIVIGITLIIAGLGSPILRPTEALIVLMTVIVAVLYAVIASILKLQEPTYERPQSKSEVRDHERLLHTLTAIVRDPDAEMRLKDEAPSTDTPLTDAEMLVLLQHTDKLTQSQ